MPDDRYAGRPVLRFEERHPGVRRTVLLLIALGVVIAFAIQHSAHLLR